MAHDKPWQPCNALYARFVRCQGEMAQVRQSRPQRFPAYDEAALQSLAAEAGARAVCCGLLWRPYPCYSFLATHTKLMQDKPPPDTPAWYGQQRPGTSDALELFAEDLDGRVQLAPGLPDSLRAVPSGIVGTFVATSDGAPSGMLSVSPSHPVLFPGGHEDEWSFVVAGGVARGSGVPLCCVADGTCFERPLGGLDPAPLFVFGGLALALAHVRDTAAQKVDFPAGARLVSAGRDPLASKGFPLPQAPAFLMNLAAPGCVSLGSPHWQSLRTGTGRDANVLFQDGSAVDDLESALPPTGQDESADQAGERRALLFAKVALLWRCLAPTAGDTLFCPTRRLTDATQPPWPPENPPEAIVLGPKTGGTGKGAVVMARHNESDRTVLVVALGAGESGTLCRAAESESLCWSWTKCE